MTTATKTKQPQYDLDAVRGAARGRWVEILHRIAAVPAHSLDGRHCPCPKCGGTDRFRMIDAEVGAVLCNQCFRTGNGDGFAALSWLTGKLFGAVLADVAEWLGIAPRKGKSADGNAPKNPAEHLEFLPWNELGVATWCLWKSPVTPAAVRALGGQIARYRSIYTVIALPVWGPQLDAAEPVGWSLYNITGGTLPKWTRDSNGKLQTEWVKVKLTFGSQAGIIADLEQLKSDKIHELWKLEGPSDTLAFRSLPDVPGHVAAFTNANGAGEKPAEWIISLFAGKAGRTLHDADEPGERGAIGFTDPKGLFRPGWCHAIAGKATESRHVRLPYPIVANHGPDLRDWTGNPANNFAALDKLALAASLVQAAAATSQVIEADDDPHRLARVNLRQYEQTRRGATLRFWRGEWYKYTGTHYKKIDPRELEAKVSSAIKTEFDRLNLEYQKSATKDDEPPVAKKVTTALVNNVIRATASMVVISDSVEPNTWLDREAGQREQRRYISCRNGILDLERLLAANEGDTVADVLLPHSPNWFSTICLPYDFEEDRPMPIFERFLERNLEMDPERIKLVQEWAGYCLLPDTSFQRFMALEGEGANGKSVYLAVITAMLGKENCSFVPLERFGERFDKGSTLGRLVNISADSAEMDKIAEGFLKSFTSGDPIHFDRKGIPAIEARPTARLMLAFNNRPRFSDRSSGIWRRMLLMPWRIEIPEGERVRGMDTAEYWIDSGELPGILTWAIEGLARLRAQRGFTKSSICDEALEDYRVESNPARAFLNENCEPAIGLGIPSATLYHFYRKWANNYGIMPLGERQFGKEVHRAFKQVERKKLGTRDERYWQYNGITFSQKEIFGEKTHEY